MAETQRIFVRNLTRARVAVNVGPRGGYHYINARETKDLSARPDVAGAFLMKYGANSFYPKFKGRVCLVPKKDSPWEDKLEEEPLLVAPTQSPDAMKAAIERELNDPANMQGAVTPNGDPPAKEANETTPPPAGEIPPILTAEQEKAAADAAKAAVAMQEDADGPGMIDPTL